MDIKKHKHAIVVSLIGLALVTGSLLIYHAFYRNVESAATNEIERQQKQLAAVAVDEIERYFYDIQKRMESIALSPTVQDAQRSEACNLYLQKLVEVNSQELNNLGRVNKEGTFICAVNRTIVGEPVSKYGDYFSRVASDPQHKPAMSRLILPTGSANPVIALHVPVFDNKGQFNGTIGGAVYFDELQKHILGGPQVSHDGIVAIYDDNLDVLYSPDPLIQGKNLNASEVTRLYEPNDTFKQFLQDIKNVPTEGIATYNLRGKQHRVIYKSAHVIGRHWTVIVAIPSHDIKTLTDQQQLARNLFVIVCTLLILSTTALAYTFLQTRTSRLARKK